jgi:uncharacterized repeat protein (TIGR01451 family)
MTFYWLENLRSRLPGSAGAPAGGPRGRRDTRDAAASGCPGGVRPAPALFSRWLRAALLIVCLAPLPARAVNNGDQIVNRAEFNTREFSPVVSSVTVTASVQTAPPRIEFLKYAPLLADALQERVAQTSYRTGSDPAAPFAAMPPPIPAGSSTPIDLAQLVPLTGTDVFHQCEPIFVRLTDQAGNLDPGRADSAVVTVSVPSTGDQEVLRLTETGPNTGVFTGYIQSAGSACLSNPAPGTYSGYLPVADASRITALFSASGGNDDASASAIVDPFGIVFNSVNGKPVDGAIITLIDASTGNPATVFGDDGVSSFPTSADRSITSGGVPAPTDSSGRLYAYAPGQFRFPFVKPGSYRFKVTPPPGYAIPTAASDISLQQLPGGPFALALGSRLETFSVNPGPALHIDIPLDPLPASLWLQKSAGKSIVSVGDFLPYQLDLQNNDVTATAVNVSITDTLPPGFRYRKGSTTMLGKQSADPDISADGRTLTYALADLAPKGTTSLRYLVEVAAGAKLGAAVNVATAHSFATTSNAARASVKVQSDFLTSRSILMGRVERGPCNLDWDEGVEGIRIYLEDGTFVSTDKRGMFHFEGVQPGSHVVQLDLDSLPEGFEVYSCADNTRFAGRSFSQFVDLQGGTMWRADFRVGRPDDVALYQKKVAQRVAAELKATQDALKITKARLQGAEEARKGAEAAAKEDEEEALPVDDWAEPAQTVPVTGAKGAEPETTLDEPEDEEPGVTAVTGVTAAPVTRVVASLELSSSLEKGGVIFTPTIAASRTPIETQRLEVELPQGLSYRPGSATRDGRPLADPRIQGRTLSFALASLAPESKVALSFATDFAADARSGEYITRAVLSYATRQGAAGRTPYADNMLLRIKEEERDALPTMIVRPAFDTFEDQLSASDRKMLDETILTIRTLTDRGLLQVRQLLLVGHTDNVRIARRSRRVHRDNAALSMARAKSVAIYLKEQMGLTPAQISASGKGETSPVANNRTAEGRALNRRVEVIILADKVVERVHTRMKKDKSGVQLGGLAATPDPLAGQRMDDDAAAGAPAGAEKAQRTDTPTPTAALPGAWDATPFPANPAWPGSGILPDAKAQPLQMSVAASAQGSVGACLFPRVQTFESAAAAGEKDPVKEEPRLTTVGILSPANGSALPDAISAVRVVLESNLTPQLFVDGVEIPADRIGFTLKDNQSGKTLYSYIGVDFGDPGVRIVTLKGKDPFGIVRLEKTAKITRVGAIAIIRFVSAEGNVADGKTPVRMKLELFDAAGVPFRSATELQILEGTLKPLKKDILVPDPVLDKAERVQVDADGYVLFQPVSASGPYRTVLGAGKATVEAETYAQPKMRDWILVGLGEGTLGYNTLSGHMENLRSLGTDENLYESGRLAFYGKGTIQGKWLLSLAYDSAKTRPEQGNSLFQTINPESFYTLYGDASQQQYDAASAAKLYLKIEREQFYAMFGDFDTNLTVTELSRYSRRLNGVKSEWQGRNFEANVFGSDTAQAYARDEIAGDGTSGLYRLSQREIVLNSEKIAIQTRDRFRSEIIVNARIMNRFSDYSIDYDTGAIFFKEPIPSRDENFNPVFIVAEYETAGAGSNALTYGGRVGAKLFDNRLKTGFSYLHEGQVSGEGNSYGVDAAWKLAAGTTLKTEAARTSTDFGGSSRDGSAYLAELQHQTPALQGKLYFREQDTGFGLGQQNGSETGTRKFGLDATYKLTEHLSLGGEGYRQYHLSTGAVQDILEAKTTYTTGPYSAHLGGRYAGDTLGDGSHKVSNQLTMGGSWLTLDKRLTLKADHDQSLGGNDNASFPSRTSFGADYKLTEKVTATAQQEFTYGSGADTNSTRVGLKSTPWSGGAVNTSLGRDLNENGDRLFALFGLKQSWKITEKWSVDGGVDRSQTVRNARNYSFNVNVPPASGPTTSEDFSAVSLGTTYTDKLWNWNNRVEYRTSTSEEKWGVVSAFVGEPKEGWGWSSRLQLYETSSSVNGNTSNDDLRLGLVYRPLQTRWIILDRLDLIYNNQGSAPLNPGLTTTSLESRRLVNNLNANFRPDRKSELSLQYGAKYVLETIDNARYSGYTDLIGVEGRYDLTKVWDIGARCSLLHSWGPGQLSYSTGLSVGYNMVQNAWLSLGYNLLGFKDKDFSVADYTAQGPYLRFRFKFDQNSVKDAVRWVNL